MDSKLCCYLSLSLVFLLSFIDRANGGILDKLTETIFKVVDGPESEETSNSVLQHGSTYAFKSVTGDLALTALRHKFSKTGIIPGIVRSEVFNGKGSQLWDAALSVHANKRQEPEFWMINHQNTVNTLNTNTGPDRSQDSAVVLGKSFVKLTRVSDTNMIFLIHSVQRNACVQNEGRDQKITYAPCDSSLVNQQWMAEKQPQ